MGSGWKCFGALQLYEFQGRDAVSCLYGLCKFVVVICESIDERKKTPRSGWLSSAAIIPDGAVRNSTWPMLSPYVTDGYLRYVRTHHLSPVFICTYGRYCSPCWDVGRSMHKKTDSPFLSISRCRYIWVAFFLYNRRINQLFAPEFARIRPEARFEEVGNEWLCNIGPQRVLTSSHPVTSSCLSRSMDGQIWYYIICTMSMARHYDAGISYLVETGVLIKSQQCRAVALVCTQ